MLTNHNWDIGSGGGDWGKKYFFLEEAKEYKKNEVQLTISF